MTSHQAANFSTVIAMLALLASLVWLQRRQSRMKIDCWLVALSLALVGQCMWFFGQPGDALHTVAHVVRLNAYLLSGLALTLFTGCALRESPVRIKFLCGNIVALAGLETVYGFGVTVPKPYLICAALGIIVAAAIGAEYQRDPWMTASLILAWSAIAAAANTGHVRAAAYWGLAEVYSLAAINLWKHLPRRSSGRVMVTVSVALWAASCLAHPWVMEHRYFELVADEVWDVQKYFIIVGMLMVLLELEIAENKRMAEHDPLTSLPNRLRVEKHLQEAIAAGRAGVRMLDLDGFKAINDTFGHLVGDRLLQRVADILQQLVDDDEMLARVGGDEFLIVSPRDLHHTGAAIRAILQEPIVLDDQKMRVGASVGVSSFPEDADADTGTEAATRLVRVADRRMYMAKRRAAMQESPTPVHIYGSA